MFIHYSMCYPQVWCRMHAWKNRVYLKESTMKFKFTPTKKNTHLQRTPQIADEGSQIVAKRAHPLNTEKNMCVEYNIQICDARRPNTFVYVCVCVFIYINEKHFVSASVFYFLFACQAERVTQLLISCRNNVKYAHTCTSHVYTVMPIHMII